MKVITSIRTNLFNVAVVISLCIILFFIAGAKLIPNQGSIKAEKEICHTTDDLSGVKSKSPLMDLQSNKTSNQIIKTKMSTGLNSVKISEITGYEQKVIVESNSWQLSPDVILVQKGLRTNWVFRLANNEECSGKILIEKFGMVIPITGKEMSVNFAPYNDFAITCNQGKFNYYIKVVEKLSSAATNTNNQNNITQKSLPQKQSAKAVTVTKETTNPVLAAKSEVNIKQKDSGGAGVPSPETNKENNVRNKQLEAKDEPVKQPENEKGGILNKLFHHHH
ncbi:MAG: hypothetical protein N3B21_09750 [Clostridia bacterium]|nr:hypothetical protein [Clostridia bacterium]